MSVARVGSFFWSNGFTASNAACAPCTLASKSTRSVREYRSSSPVIFDADTSLSSSTAPLAIAPGCSSTSFARFWRVSTFSFSSSV